MTLLLHSIRLVVDLSQFCRLHVIGSVKSPWLANVNVGDVHVIPISHGEGRFVAPKEVIDELFANGQVFSQIR